MLRSLAFTAPLREFANRHGVDLRVFIAAFCWLACSAWLRPLYLPDEGRYVGVALEMLRSGNWVSPTLDGLPFFHKPPLFYWITALAFHLFGTHEWAARSCSLLSASSVVAAFHSALREWLGMRIATLAALVLSTMPMFFGAAQFANMDMLVAACISCSILSGARAAFRIDSTRPYRQDLAWGFIAAALGVLAKGLIGIVLPAAVLIVWLATQRRWRVLKTLCWWPGFAIFSVIAGPWFIAAQLQHRGFWHYFFVVQHFQRFTGSGFNNAQPGWFYFPVLLAFLLPWSLWLLWLLPPLRRAHRLSMPRHDVMMLMWIWAGVVVAFFSVPGSKLIGYVLPAIPPLAALIAMAAAPRIAGSARHLRSWRISTVAAVAFCIGPVVFFTIKHPKSSRDIAEQLGAKRAAHEGVAVIDNYIYDLPFYLHDTSPIVIVSNWDPREIEQHDNWRRELGDAAVFAPHLASERLVDNRQFAAMLCSGKIRWVIGVSAHVTVFPFLGVAGAPWVQGGRALWHADTSSPAFRQALACDAPTPGMPP